MSPGRLRTPLQLLGFAALLLLTADLVGQDPAGAGGAAEPAYLNVKVPASARLEIEGRLTQSTGGLRNFVSPPLAPGKKYSYTLKLTFKNADGQEVTRTDVVAVAPGKTFDVDLVTPKKDETPVTKKDDAKTTPPPPPPPATKKETTKADPPPPPPAAAVKEDPKEDRKPDVIFVPTPAEVVEKMLELAEVKKDDVVYDLGCGDGIIVCTAAKKFGCKATGFDIDPERIKDSNDRVKKDKLESLVTIEKKDIFTLDLSKANVITLYLLPSLNVKLIPQLEKLKPGSRIVSHDFDMKGVKPDKVVKVTPPGGREHTVYLWTVPLNKEKD